MTVPQINKLIKEENIDKSGISDGYHTFRELYSHRNTLFVVLCKEIYFNPAYQQGQKANIWKTIYYSNGEEIEKSWFLMGIGYDSGEQITYHLPMSYWTKAEFADTLDKAPPFDKHTSDDVLSRLFNL